MVTGAVSVTLAACSFGKIDWLNPTSEPETVGSVPTWSYQREFNAVLPESLSQLTGGQVMIKGQCHFSGKMMKAGFTRQKTILMPLLRADEDGTLAPAFKESLPVYQSLDSFLNLAPESDSFQLFQRWISSLEHACPEGLNRELSSCSFKQVYTLNGLWGSHSLYNFERVNHWLGKAGDNRYLLIPGFSLLTSKAALNLRYSPNTNPIVQKTAFERIAMVSQHLGRPSLDWLKLNEQGQLGSELISSGRCSVSWQELEQLRDRKGESHLSPARLNQIDVALTPVLQRFMNEALSHLKLSKQQQ